MKDRVASRAVPLKHHAVQILELCHLFSPWSAWSPLQAPIGLLAREGRSAVFPPILFQVGIFHPIIDDNVWIFRNYYPEFQRVGPWKRSCVQSRVLMEQAFREIMGAASQQRKAFLYNVLC